jgi:hypothetical protein
MCTELSTDASSDRWPEQLEPLIQRLDEVPINLIDSARIKLTIERLSANSPFRKYRPK